MAGVKVTDLIPRAAGERDQGSGFLSATKIANHASLCKMQRNAFDTCANMRKV